MMRDLIKSPECFYGAAEKEISCTAILVFMYGVSRYLWFWPEYWDLMLWDESVYMANGIYYWGSESLSNHESSPLYSWLYHVMNNISDSPEDLFYKVGILVVVGAIASVFLASLYLSSSLFLALALTSVLVLGNFPMIGPRLVYAAVIIIMSGGALGYSMSTLPARLSCLALTAFITAFIRPEFSLAFHLLFASAIVVLVYIVIKQKSELFCLPRLWPGLYFSVFTLIAVAVLCFLWSYPKLSGGGRAFMAFGQHYSLYWANETKSNVEPFLNWESIIQRELPGVQSEVGALVSHPAKILRFFLYNIVKILTELSDAFYGLYRNYMAFVWCLALSLLCIYMTSRYSLIKAESLHGRGKVSVLIVQDILIWCLLSSPVLISIIIIYPRPHYLIVLFALVILLVSAVAKRLNVSSHPLVALGISLAFALSVNPVQPISRYNLDLVKKLETFGYLGTMLEIDGGWCFFIPKQCVPSFVTQIPRGVTVYDYLDKASIDSVLISPLLMGYLSSNSEKKFISLIASPETEGWSKVDLSRDNQLLTRVPRNHSSDKMLNSPDLTRYVSDIKLGDRYGVIRHQSAMTFFIHPGESSDTKFSFRAGDFVRGSGCKSLQFTACMDGNIPQDVFDRGGGRVVFAINRGNEILFSELVDGGHQGVYTSSPGENDLYGIVVGNEGNSDTDWMNLKISFIDCD